MMAAILNTAMLDSYILLCSLRFTQKHSNCTLTLTQPNSIWLICWWQTSWILPSWIQLFWTKKTTSLIHSDSTWRWQPSWNLPTWIQPLCTKKLHSYILTHLDDGSHLEFCHLEFCHLGFNTNWTIKNFKLIHSHSTWWWKPSWILPSWIQTFWTNKILHSFIVTQLDDGSHLELCHVGFSHCHLGFKHLVIFSQIPSKTLSLHPDSDSN